MRQGLGGWIVHSQCYNMIFFTSTTQSIRVSVAAKCVVMLYVAMMMTTTMRVCLFIPLGLFLSCTLLRYQQSDSVSTAAAHMEMSCEKGTAS